jgi:hypothetical protein
VRHGLLGVLLLATLELVRRRAASGESAASYVRVRRHFDLNLDWLIETQVERMAPEKGGFTLQLPLLKGERVLTNGVTTVEGAQMLAVFDSDSAEFSWSSALPHTDSLQLTALREKSRSEAWTFTVNPTWHVEFAGVPAVMPENTQSGNDYSVGRRITGATLRFEYRSTRGGRHGILLPEGARVTSFSVDGRSVPIRVKKSELALSLSRGSHSVQIDWEFPRGTVRAYALSTGGPPVAQ